MNRFIWSPSLLIGTVKGDGGGGWGVGVAPPYYPPSETAAAQRPGSAAPQGGPSRGPGRG